MLRRSLLCALMALVALFSVWPTAARADDEPAAALPGLALVLDKSWWSQTSFTAYGADYRTLAGDFDGDGRSDIAMLYPTDATTVDFYVLTSTGTQFAWQDSWLQLGGFLTAAMMTGRVVAGDFDNDGKDDIAAFAGTGSTFLYVFPSTGTAFATAHAPWQQKLAAYQNSITGRVIAGDFDGDGWRDDIAALYHEAGNTTSAHVYISNGSTFSATQIWWDSTAYAGNRATHRVVAGDWNADGVDDLAEIYDYGNHTTRALVHLSTKSSFDYRGSWWLSQGYNASEATGRVVAGDFDGDDDDDIVLLYRYPSLIRAHVLLSDRDSFAYQGSAGWRVSTTHVGDYGKGRTVAGDWDGNGVGDVGLIDAEGPTSTAGHVLLSTALSPGSPAVRPIDGADPACSDATGNPYCTVQAAVHVANGGDTLQLAAGARAEHVTLPRYANRGFNQQLLVQGAGAESTIVDGSDSGTVFTIYAGGDVTLSDLRIQHGSAQGSNGQFGYGGGIHNLGRPTVRRSHVVDNRASTGFGGGIYNAQGSLWVDQALIGSNSAFSGAGLFNHTGAMTVTASTIRENVATFPVATAFGGGVHSEGEGATTLIAASAILQNNSGDLGGGLSQIWGARTTVINSTVSGNLADKGAGLLVYDGSLQVANSTITANTAADEGGGLHVFDGGTARLDHVIVASNASPLGANCQMEDLGSAIVSQGHNLGNDRGCNLTQPTDLPDRDPGLGPLQRAGATEVHPLLAGSLAIDAGSAACGTDRDQQGMTRPQDGNGDAVATCDIGAYEAGAGLLYLPLLVR